MKRGSPPPNDRLTELAVDSDPEAQEYFLSDSPVIHKGGLSMEARVPVAASLNYPVEFANLTGGKRRIKHPVLRVWALPAGDGKDSETQGDRQRVK